MANPLVSITTELGEIIVELYPGQAPVTVENFLRYTHENRFSGAAFYRVVCADNQPNNEIKIEVIQGGLEMKKRPRSFPPSHMNQPLEPEYFTRMGPSPWRGINRERPVPNSSFALGTSRNWILAADATPTARGLPLLGGSSKGWILRGKFTPSPTSSNSLPR